MRRTLDCRHILKKFILIKATNTKLFLHLIKYACFATCSRLNKNIDSNSRSEFTSVNPVLVYTNADLDKLRIFEDNRNKAGVYRWVNSINNKTYIGSSTNIFSRPFSPLALLEERATLLSHSIYRTFSSVSCQPVVVYDNADIDKVKFLADNSKKSGVYCWTNKITGKKYVGSSVDLKRRFYNYYSIGYLLRETTNNNSYIYRALLKYGYTNFSIEILEYCDPENCVQRENYYLNLLKPKYNVLSVAGSNLGFKHSEETKAKFALRKSSEEARRRMSEAKKGINNPNFGKTHSEETKALIRAARLGKSLISDSIKERMSKKGGTSLRVVDLETNEISIYTSIKKAAQAMGISQPAISARLKQTKGTFILKKRYQVEKVNS